MTRRMALGMADTRVSGRRAQLPTTAALLTLHTLLALCSFCSVSEWLGSEREKSRSKMHSTRDCVYVSACVNSTEAAAAGCASVSGKDSGKKGCPGLSFSGYIRRRKRKESQESNV